MEMTDREFQEFNTKYFSYALHDGKTTCRFIAGAFPIVDESQNLNGISTLVFMLLDDLTGVKSPIYDFSPKIIDRRSMGLLKDIVEARDDALRWALNAYGLPLNYPIFDEAPDPQIARTDCVYRFNTYYVSILKNCEHLPRA